MLASRDFLTPRLNGVLYFEKPPLYYWTVAASIALLGPTELAVRLPGKLAAVSMVLLAVAFARRRWGTRTGLLAGLILATSILLVALARIALIDPMLSAALSAATFAFASFAEAEAAGETRRARRALYALPRRVRRGGPPQGPRRRRPAGRRDRPLDARHGPMANARPRLFGRGPSFSSAPSRSRGTSRWPSAIPTSCGSTSCTSTSSASRRPEHRRPGPAVYFVPVLLAGFLPWTGFFGRFREAWPGFSRGGWRARGTEGFLWIWSPSSSRSSRRRARSSSRTSSRSGPHSPCSSRSASSAPVHAARSSGQTGASRRRSSGSSSRRRRRTGGAPDTSSASEAHARASSRSQPSSAGSSSTSRLDFSARGGAEIPSLMVAAPWLTFVAGLLIVLPGAAREITPWPIASRALEVLEPDDLLLQKGHYLEVLPFYARRASRRSLRSGGASWTSAARTPEPRRSFRPTKRSRRTGTGAGGSSSSCTGTSSARSGGHPCRRVPRGSSPRETSGKHVLLSNRRMGSRSNTLD